jgi:hypothetical protein
MRAVVACVVAASTLLAAAAGSRSAPAVFEQQETIQVTQARARAQTTRSSGRCLCADQDGNAHMTWEDGRHLNEFEIYYTSTSGDSVLPEIRITETPYESSYPAIDCGGREVYIVWEEVLGRDSEIFCVHLQERREVARIRVTDTNLDSSCPVCAVGPDGSVHVAWHEGPFKQTGIYYARIVNDSVTTTTPICTTDPESFRPDIACDTEGRVMIVWLAGLKVMSRLWDGETWREVELVAPVRSRPWRLSVAALPGGTWVATWFDRYENGQKVLAAFYDGQDWYGQTVVSAGRQSYYPNVTALDGGGLVVGWEERLQELDLCTIVIRSFDGMRWGEPMEIYRDRINGRYVSVANSGNVLHAFWFSGRSGSNEVYYSRLRKE